MICVTLRYFFADFTKAFLNRAHITCDEDEALLPRRRRLRLIAQGRGLPSWWALLATLCGAFPTTGRSKCWIKVKNPGSPAMPRAV